MIKLKHLLILPAVCLVYSCQEEKQTAKSSDSNSDSQIVTEEIEMQSFENPNKVIKVVDTLFRSEPSKNKRFVVEEIEMQSFEDTNVIVKVMDTTYL